MFGKAWGPYVERTDEEVVEAWEEALESHTDPDSPMVVGRNRSWSVREAVELLRTVLDARQQGEDLPEDRMPWGLMVDGLKRNAKEDGFDPVKLIGGFH